VLLTFSALAFFAYRNILRTVAETQKVDDTMHSLKAMKAILDDMQDIETSQRGYIITQDPKYLEPYNEALKTMNPDTLAIRELANRDRSKKAALERLMHFVTVKLLITDSTVETMKNGNREAAILRVQSGLGRITMDSIRFILGGLEEADENDLRDTNRQRTAAANSTATVLVALVSVLFIVLLILMFQVLKDLKRRDESEKKIMYLAELSEKTSDAIISIDTAGNILSWNMGATDIFGFNRDFAMGKPITLFTKEELPLPEIDHENLNKPSANIEWTCFSKEWEAIQCLVSMSPLYSNSDLRGYVLILRDITDRKRNEKLLKDFNDELNRQVIEQTKEKIESEAKYRQIVETTHEGIWLIDKFEKTSFVNQRMAEMLGYSREEMIGRSLFDFMDEEGKQITLNNIERRKKGIAENQEFRFNTREGRSVWALLRSSPVINNGAYEGALAMVTDITDRKKAQEQLENTNNELRKLNIYLQTVREEERAHMAREIHDELGQQLTVLKMGISWLNKKISSTDENIREKLTDLVAMIDTTVHSVRKISSELRPSMLDDLGLQAVIEWQSQEFEKRAGIKVETSLDINDIKLPGNIAVTFFRIFQESLTNIARHAEATLVKVKLTMRDDTIRMVVEDNGKGFSPKDIGEKRTLGLLGMKERVSTINGEVEMQAEPGMGTTVKVTAPLI
jgi:PAS domain S-box-containing protein